MKNDLIRLASAFLLVGGLSVVLRPGAITGNTFSDNALEQAFLVFALGVFPVVAGALWFTRSVRLSAVAWLFMAAVLFLNGIMKAVGALWVDGSFQRGGLLVAVVMVGFHTWLASLPYREAKKRLAQARGEVPGATAA